MYFSVDSSDYMRNGDYFPNRLQAEIEAITLIVQCKLRSNPENQVGVLAMSNGVNLINALTQDDGKIYMKLHTLIPRGTANFLNGIRVSQLALKHRYGRTHKGRIIVFLGSPLKNADNEIFKVAQRMKKEKIAIDVIAFGEEARKSKKLSLFASIMNSSGSENCQLVMVPKGSSLQEAVLSSPIVRREDGTLPNVPMIPGSNFDFGIDPNEDPELAMALRVSLEEQRQRQQAEARLAEAQQTTEGGTENVVKSEATLTEETASEEMDTSPSQANVEAMTEDEQILLALQLSLKDAQERNESRQEKSETAKSKESPTKSAASSVEKTTEKETASETQEVHQPADMMGKNASIEQSKGKNEGKEKAASNSKKAKIDDKKASGKSSSKGKEEQEEKKDDGSNK
ncbi:26S proteasome non-ATPase regulatory subunit 4 [Trichinella zimbabwensis]|uniref:26S proteasome non-ATPase regulatory subunit 4 n=2 Tax=Trichinella TaxID=6333 RepID=A0A0V1MK02_9BILA|nr:26S proteasome non-ATPase regulatory subunit 4 [Trichinella zimbabwensis]KRZ71914.1 26S proteasome non-ATPase regulatory subunit 4 [Trichinella papuae]